MNLKDIYRSYACFVLLFFLSFLGISQELNPNINQKNFVKIVDSAFWDIAKYGKNELASDVIDYIEYHEVKLSDSNVLSIYYFLKGDEELHFGRNDLSSSYYRKSEKIFRSLGQIEKQALALDNLGTNKTAFKEYDSSYYFGLEALKLLQSTDNEYLLIDLYYNLSYRCSNLKKWEESDSFAKKSIKLIKKEKVKQSRSKYMYNNLAKNSIKVGAYETAKRYIDSALKLSNEKDAGFLSKALAYKNLGRYYSEQKQYKLAAENFDKVNSLFAETRKSQMKINNQKVMEDIKLKRIMHLKNEEVISNQKKLLFMTIAFIILTLIAGYFFVNLYIKQKKNISYIKKLNLKIKLSLDEIENKNQDLIDKNDEINSLLQLNERTMFSKELKISTLKDAANKIKKEVSTLIDSNSTLNNFDLVNVRRSLGTLINEADVWEDFKHQFEKIRPNFFKNLLESCPKLTVNDLKHCSYIISKLKSKEVANLLNVSPRSVETTRYRLKKKLNLDSESSLYEFLQNV